MRILLLIATELVAVSHLMMAIVFFIYARRSVAYLAQAWISMLTFAIYGVALGSIAYHTTPVQPLGMLHPMLLIALLVLSFLLSINPLGMVMPGYLQAERMLRYASPAAALIIVYLLGVLVGGKVVMITDFSDLMTHILTGDVLLRICAVGLSLYYIINIIVLPHRMIRKAGYSLPANVVSYATLLGIVQVGFVLATIWFSYTALIIYDVLFTAVSVMLGGCMIKAHLESLPYPQIHQVEEPPTQQEITVIETQDFNEANARRFESIEYAMQHERPFVAPDFNRDRLTRLSGFNRHILLQTLRSQGYNDVHDYITRYRVRELRRLIETGVVTDVRQHDMVGFRTLKTAQLAFERYEHEELAAFIAAQQAGGDYSMPSSSTLNTSAE